jgi:hypothetical protein
VILSPRSHDHGFDIAAAKRGQQVLDEAKAYKQSLLVGHQIVRAALGLMVEHAKSDQVRVTTTSWFAPLVLPDFNHLIPNNGPFEISDACCNGFVRLALFQILTSGFHRTCSRAPAYAHPLIPDPDVLALPARRWMVLRGVV